ncbi:bifunctional glutamate N-acetyltransferase/amino-acid acetyltransferase ArgJ [Maritalea porphyrae]|uniref:bifunctional glutamate N-acetyltransferase/amino-acid acetyltransferase ArgJ n=1 Tax=Maritalea porphyrae TaxID=880732 RepID=UPI0022AED4A9|nr:bifunctional glutamate N-acetyltransferase/amino-acid acetyltransferase ArgJ [Maritalea porphyrae]MCZ4273894.1 bifunctional glutamate N-acetyltransferase/amino-acid acetyltransferase ArgJ [Maritalea porphyrae]
MAKVTAVSPLAPESFPGLAKVEGAELFTASIGEGYHGRANLFVARMVPGTTVAGVLTKSKCPSAPIDWCKQNLVAGSARALVVNAGNANAFVGKVGAQTVQKTADAAAELLHCEPGEVFISSTGVIGEPLDAKPLVAALAQSLKQSADYEAAANTIRTTDTFAKGAGASFDLDGVDVCISGIAKGSGMIAPNMATMLSYIFTDVPIAANVLQAILVEGNAKSFNAITVDSDTSTSDTCLVFATGAAKGRGLEPITSLDDPRCTDFSQALHAVLHDLALQIIRDGEGATKLMVVKVVGATSDQSADVIARSIANSPLVKTALAGEDANWGRVVAAVGKAGEPADRDKLQIRFGDLVVAKEGYRSPDYSEAVASQYMKNQEIEIGVDLGLGAGEATIYGCDLTHGYVSINGDYRS